MATKVISIRMTPKELADIYNYLIIACEVDIKTMPVSVAITASLSHMMKWVSGVVDLPEYETEADAIIFLEETLDKIPTCFMPDIPMPKFDTPLKEIPRDLLPIITEPNSMKGTAQTIEEHVPLVIVDRAQVRELAEQRKDKVVGLIEKFTEKQDAKDMDELVNGITNPDLYKKE